MTTLTIVATAPLTSESRCYGSFTFSDGVTVKVSGGLVCSQHGRHHCKHHKEAHAAIIALHQSRTQEPDPSGSPCSPEAQALVLDVIPTIQRTAVRLAYTYGWANPRIEIDDLKQLGTLACLEVLQKGLHVTGNPAAYLVVVARHAMQRYCGMYASLITTPRKSRGYYPKLQVVSLDAPLFADSDTTLLDQLIG